MKLSEYIASLVELEEKFADLEVVYASDEEGSSFHLVINGPTIGDYDHSNTAFAETVDEDDLPNAICIN